MSPAKIALTVYFFLRIGEQRAWQAHHFLSAGSSGSSVYDVSEEKTNGTRLARLLVDGGTHVLRNFLHSIYPPATLQHVLNNNRAKLKGLKSKGIIFKKQWEMLFPPSGIPDSEKFDITLLHLLLREICNLTEAYSETLSRRNLRRL